MPDDSSDSSDVIAVTVAVDYILTPIGCSMARITVRNIEESVLQTLRKRGAARGVSMEQEARDLLAAAVGMPTTEGFDYTGLSFDDEDVVPPDAKAKSTTD